MIIHFIKYIIIYLRCFVPFLQAENHVKLLNFIITYFIMSKSFRHHKKSLGKRLKSRNLRNCNRTLRVGNKDQVKCCICEKSVDLKDTFTPLECLIKYGKTGHRICHDCWWNSDTGFGLQTSSHRCPGCEKGLPLTQYKKEAPIFVDLTDD